MSVKPTTREHENFFNDFVELLKKYEHLPATELLALASNVTGRLCAMQDQNRFSPDQVMELVVQNLQSGNQQMVALLTSETAGSA